MCGLKKKKDAKFFEGVMYFDGHLPKEAVCCLSFLRVFGTMFSNLGQVPPYEHSDTSLSLHIAPMRSRNPDVLLDPTYSYKYKFLFYSIGSIDTVDAF